MTAAEVIARKLRDGVNWEGLPLQSASAILEALRAEGYMVEKKPPCVFEHRNADGQNGTMHGVGRAWCQTHGFSCPQLTNPDFTEFAKSQ